MCGNEAKYRFTWPGSDEATICEDYVDTLRAIANALGLHLQVIPLSEEDLKVGFTCNQK